MSRRPRTGGRRRPWDGVLSLPIFSCGRRGIFVNSADIKLPSILLITWTFLFLVHPCGEEDDEVAGFTNDVSDMECFLSLLFHVTQIVLIMEHIYLVILSELLHKSEFFPLPSAAARLHTSAHHRYIFRGTIFGHWRLPHPGCPRNGGRLFCQREQSAATVPINAKILRISSWLQLWLQRQHPAPATIGPRKILLVKHWHDFAICALHTYREENYGRLLAWWNSVLLFLACLTRLCLGFSLIHYIPTIILFPTLPQN